MNSTGELQVIKSLDQPCESAVKEPGWNMSQYVNATVFEIPKSKIDGISIASG
jgi:hypothetical protein